MFFLSGVARYLFVPLAEAVVFAMLASYILSRTLVPTLAMYLLKAKLGNPAESRNPLVRFQRAFERAFERIRKAYHARLTALVHRRVLFVPAFLLTCMAVFLLVPWLGQDFFPTSDNGQFILHLRAKSGTRIEETAKLCDLIEGTIRREIPEHELDNILDNIGLPYSTINFMHSTSGLIGAGDADILVSLKQGRHSTANYMERLRETLPREYPGRRSTSYPRTSSLRF
jgi:multidrug efflux pump subunit AcrB